MDLGLGLEDTHVLVTGGNPPLMSIPMILQLKHSQATAS